VAGAAAVDAASDLRGCPAHVSVLAMNDETTLGTTILLPEPPTGWFDYGYAVLMDGTLALVRTDRDVHAEFARWRAQSKRGRTPAKLWDGRMRLSVFDGSVESEAIEVPLGFVPIVERLADGRWLVAASRAAEGETNARLFASDGAPAGAFAIGDGVEHIRCAADGTIWVGYFDEGVFSGPSKDGTWPISSSGIARLAPDGTALWIFNTEDRADLSIADCYALTLNENTLWSCFYTDFLIVRVRSGVARYWRNGVREPRRSQPTAAMSFSPVVTAITPGGSRCFASTTGRLGNLAMCLFSRRHMAPPGCCRAMEQPCTLSVKDGGGGWI
jgi:hypothetical protein